MKRGVVIVLVIIFALCCIGCQKANNDSGDVANEEQKAYTLDVSFTAKVDELIDDPNAGEDVPRYAVVRPFQANPVLVDVGINLAKTLEEDETYTFVMEQAQNVKMIEEKSQNLDLIIPLYNLKVKSVEAPEEGQTGLDAVKIEYTEVNE